MLQLLKEKPFEILSKDLLRRRCLEHCANVEMIGDLEPISVREQEEILLRKSLTDSAAALEHLLISSEERRTPLKGKGQATSLPPEVTKGPNLFLKIVEGIVVAGFVFGK